MNRPQDRFKYSALPQRQQWKLPNDARIAVYTIVNIEEWDIEKPIVREYVTSPAGVVTVPNIPNWAILSFIALVVLFPFWRMVPRVAGWFGRVNGRIAAAA